MSTLDNALSDRLNNHIRDVRQVLQGNGANSEEISILTENLYDHAFSTAEAMLEKYSVEEAVDRTLSGLQPPETYADRDFGFSGKDVKIASTVKVVLGVVSILFMGGSLALSAMLSDKIMFDVHHAGAIFLFGQIIAFGTGIAALPSILGRAGALCSAFMLMFLATGFLWNFFSGTG